MRLVPFSFSQQFGLYYYDPEIDTIYKTTYKKIRFDIIEAPAFVAAFLIACIILIRGYEHQWPLWKWLAVNPPLCIATVFAANAYIRGAEKVIRNGETLVLARARRKELKRLLFISDSMRIAYYRFVEYKYSLLVMFSLWLFFGCFGLWDEVFFCPVALALLEMSIYVFVCTRYDKHRKDCIRRVKKLLKNFEVEHNLNSQKCADRMLEIFPYARPDYEKHLMINERVVIQAFALEVLPEPFQKARLLGEQITVPQGYFELIEDMWRFGDDDVFEAVCVMITDYFKSNSEIWGQFCAAISGKTLSEINRELCQSNG